MQTKKQKQREQLAQSCAQIGGDKSPIVKQLRATNRRVEKRKRAQKSHAL